MRRLVRRWGFRLHLIRYCERCDGSINEANERGRNFRPDRWVLHFRHERRSNPGPLLGRSR